MAEPRRYKCRKGDHISKIAADHCCSDWETVWKANPELQEVRKNPNMLRPGDELTIPLPEDDRKQEGTGQTHTHKAERSKLALRLAILKEDHTPISDAPYTLQIEGEDEPRNGKTDAKGEIEAKAIPRTATKAMLTVQTPAPASEKGEIAGDIPVVWELAVGELEPIVDSDTNEGHVMGVQQRLSNLGFDCSATGTMSDATKAAIRAFRKKFMESDSDRNDENFRRKLAEAHDDPGWSYVPTEESHP